MSHVRQGSGGRRRSSPSWAAWLVAVTAPANAAATNLVISEVYGAANVAPASYGNDFIEIYNPTATDVDVDGWSVQYHSAAGTGSVRGDPTDRSGRRRARATWSRRATSRPVPRFPTPDAQGSIAACPGRPASSRWSPTRRPTRPSAAAPRRRRPRRCHGQRPGGPGRLRNDGHHVRDGATGVNLTSATSAQRVGADTDHNAERLRRAGAHARGVRGGLRRPGDPAGRVLRHDRGDPGHHRRLAPRG